MSLPSPPSFERYLAVDLHKHYVVIGGLNARQEIVLAPRRVELTDWPAWAKSHLRKTDILVVEATTNTWDFYDQCNRWSGVPWWQTPARSLRW